MNPPDGSEPRPTPDPVEEVPERGRSDADPGEGPGPSRGPATNCLNCGAPLHGPYCAQCGQKDEREIPSVGKLIGDLAGDVFELDSRIWRTVRRLVVRPGSLTEEYLAGRRARYLPPLRLFMATGIIMILVYSLSGNSLFQIEESGDGSGEGDPAVESIEEADGAETLGDTIDAGAPAGDPGDEEAPEAAEELDFSERLSQAVARRVSQDPEGIQEAFAENLPRMMFLFLPLAAGMLMLLYLGSGRRYVEHLVFSLHAHAFVFLELSVARSLRTWVVGADTGIGVAVALGAFAWTLVYFFLALRRVYEQGRLVTSIKFVVLVGGYGVLLTTLLALTAIVTVFFPV